MRLTSAEGERALYDPVLHRRVNLGRVSCAIIDRMDGRLSCGEIIAEVCREVPSLGSEEVEHTLRTFLLMSLTEGAGSAVLMRVQAIKEGREPLRPITLPGSRFACQGSGQCCHNYLFGPLTDEDVDRLSRLDLAKVFPDLATASHLVERTGEGGEAERYLRAIDERCVFLLPDRRCGIHAHFGVEHKPRLCRIYPLQDVPTALGWKIYDRGECAMFAVSACAGPILAEDMARITDLLGEPSALYHPLVFLDPHTPCDYGHILPLQDALAALAARDETSSIENLLAMGALAERFATEVRACPLEAGEPDRTVSRVLSGAPGEGMPSEGPERAAGLRAIIAVVDHILRATTPSLFRAARSPESYLAVREFDRFLVILHAMKTLALDRLEPGSRPCLPGDIDPALRALAGYYRAVDRVEAASAEIERAMRISLANLAFGLRLCISGQLRPGMMRMSLIYLFSLIGGKLLAAQDGRESVGPGDLSQAHSLGQRVFGRSYISDVLLAEQERSFDVLRGAAALLAPPGEPRE